MCTSLTFKFLHRRLFNFLYTIALTQATRYHLCKQSTTLGPVNTKRQRQHCDNSAMMLAILFSLKSVELLKNGLQPHSGVTPLFSMRTELQASSQSCRSDDADASCKRGLIVPCLLKYLCNSETGETNKAIISSSRNSQFTKVVTKQ